MFAVDPKILEVKFFWNCKKKLENVRDLMAKRESYRESLFCPGRMACIAFLIFFFTFEILLL